MDETDKEKENEWEQRSRTDTVEGPLQRLRSVGCECDIVGGDRWDRTREGKGEGAEKTNAFYRKPAPTPPFSRK